MKYWYAYYAIVVTVAFFTNLINSGTWLAFLLAPMLLFLFTVLVILSFFGICLAMLAIADRFQC